MTGEIRFATGLVEYSLNGKCTVAFNPTDSAFAEKLARLFEALDEKQESLRRKLAEAEGEEVFALSAQMDAQMREMLDGLFGKPVCQALFGDMNVYALAGGLPVWANLLTALIDEMGDSFRKEQAKTNPALEKYLAKYRG